MDNAEYECINCGWIGDGDELTEDETCPGCDSDDLEVTFPDSPYVDQ